MLTIYLMIAAGVFGYLSRDPLFWYVSHYRRKAPTIIVRTGLLVGTSLLWPLVLFYAWSRR